MSKQPFVVRNGQAETLSVMGTQVHLLCEADKTDNKWSLMDCVMPKDAGPPPHQHPWDEAYFVLSGQVRFSLDGREVLAGSGDFLYAPANTPHGLQGASDEPAHVLFFDAPAAAEGFFREVEREVKQLPQDLPKVPRIGERHRIHFLPPQ